jgi:hypothetical protein
MNKFKDVNIFTANVRGLMKNFKLIEAENLNEYSLLKFYEVWQIKEFENIKIKGFKLAKKYLRDGQGGGVVIYVKEGLKYSVIKLDSIDGTFKACGIKMAKVIIISLYRPLATNKNTFKEEMVKMMDRFNGAKVIIGGEWNINFHNETNCTKDITEFYNIKPRITGITRPESGTSINNYCTNMDSIFRVSNELFCF